MIRIRLIRLFANGYMDTENWISLPVCNTCRFLRFSPGLRPVDISMASIASSGSSCRVMVCSHCPTKRLIQRPTKMGCIEFIIMFVGVGVGQCERTIRRGDEASWLKYFKLQKMKNNSLCLTQRLDELYVASSVRACLLWSWHCCEDCSLMVNDSHPGVVRHWSPQ